MLHLYFILTYICPLKINNWGMPAKTFSKQTDLVGAVASGLCLIHCVATPFIFVVQSCSATCCEASPLWWKWIDYIFLIISFFAVYQSSHNTNKIWIGRALWISWFILFGILLNERFGITDTPTYLIYIPAITLIILHLYSNKYCQCSKSCNH